MLIKIISNTLIIFALILVITLWLRNINKKRLIVTVIILLFLSILNSLKINIFTFEKSAKELISKTDTIAEKSRSFNSQRALKNLPANKMNGFYYRFSDHLDEADFENNKHAIATYLALNKEMRKVISAPVPSIIKYSLTLPEKQLFLKFGFGALDNNPVKFTAHIRSKGMEKNIFSEELPAGYGYKDIKIGLSEWAGKKIDISFRAFSKDKNTALWAEPVIYSLPEKRFNIIFVLEDALRADKMSCCGYKEKTTPYKERFVKNGVLFLKSFSQGTCTRSSCASFMTSLYPTATGVWDMYDKLSDKYLTLAEIMSSQGFATASFTQNDNSGMPAGLGQGFEVLLNPDNTGTLAEDMYSKKLYDWIESNLDRNFLLYIHIINPHGPFDPPKPFDAFYRESNEPAKRSDVKKKKDFDPEWMKNPTVRARRLLYDGEILYNDSCFEKFMERLAKYSQLEDTLIIFMGDHGEHLGEHGIWNHQPPGYIQTIHPPLIMVYPRMLPKDIKITKPVQLLDIMPTILELAGINTDKFILEGDSLLSLIREENQDFWDNRLVISEEVGYKHKKDRNEWGSIFYKDWHFVNSKQFFCISWAIEKLLKKENFPEFGLATKLFNNSKDKEEKYAIMTSIPDIFLKLKFRSIIHKLQDNNLKIWKAFTGGESSIATYDKEELDRLKALGYIN